MFPALETELKQEALPDPYEDFMYHHLQYYGYFKAQRDSLPNSATHQHVWKNNPRYLLNGCYGERDDLLPDTLQKEKLLYSFMLSSPLLRSKQLLYDELDEVNPRLQEPRDLFACFSSSGSLQAPRWPIECEVIKENIHHIEWVPPRPEYFYQPTGNEKVPEIVGEEKGIVVYQLDSVPTEGSYFTNSRVGGKRGIIKEIAVTLQGPEDNTLLFESRFESGNLQKAVRVLLEEREILLYCDFHGHSRKNNIFLYGCNNNDRKHWLHERVFPLMLSKNAPDKFSFHSCNFKVQKCKEGTGRVVMWRMGILNSYTMESTFGGSTLGNKRDTHFTIEDLTSLGYHVCDTLLDFCDPDQTKFTQCLAELKELLQQEIHKKLNELGEDMNLEGSWSDISLSDIESSTSGSDSSLSDGLPVHLQSIADELNQKKKMSKKKKKKPLKTRKQRNEQYQKNNLIRELKLTEEAPERARFTSVLQKQRTFLKNSENSTSTINNVKPRLKEMQLNGRDNGTSLDPSMSTLILTKKERMQKKEALTASCSPKRSTSSSQEPAPGMKPSWHRNSYPAARRSRPTMAVYPSLHVYTYP
ncbi:cytosolic carboxypeptidase 2 isoform X4 [Tupaia chinensis]|uniref:cytosolic carboxypeptidase 2 isoform X4 n=1 Tax=Tupaia chinensis TaxID=246437 RepID=UPI0003C8EEB6|nr:cytosolic carboxypeptidase 2 isoform X4 [Tupaia chinensis]